MFKKILIANRGEIAVRVMRACREMGIATVAVHSLADADALHVRMADQAVCVGPPSSKESYLNIANVVSAATITGAEAVHPGYGFLAENSSFAEICQQVGVKFIGPSPAAIEGMGNKSAARAKMKEAGVPIIPGTPGPVRDEHEAERAAREIGYPVILKASAGGGGKGMRVVENEAELSGQLTAARTEAEAAFGNGEVYVEKYLVEPRHVEVQILADAYGNTIHLGERDCSVQTARHQKMLEESPCAFISEKMRHALGKAAVKGAQAARYENAGTIEFLVAGNEFYFMEMNTRIQVEHPVTELVTGVDLIQQQIRVAAGEKLALRQKDVQISGHAIECRLTAEDPNRNFTPSSGVVELWEPPGGPGVRVDSHLYNGYKVPPFYDSLLAKLLVYAPTRPEAIARMRRALAETRLEGLPSTLQFYEKILTNEYFERGEISTDFLARRMAV
jgi:acetyl-CoA carboxylase biotin carboxylase subunit